MPTGDGTGPMGMGPMTGRGVGYCGAFDAPGWANWGPSRRFYGRGGSRMGGGRWGGYGAGRGVGYRWWGRAYAVGMPRGTRWGLPPTWAYGVPEPPSREQEIGLLKEEARWLKEQLDAINQRMETLGQE
jgi:hypothetical protein